MFYFALLCIFILLAVRPLHIAMQAIADARERNRAPPPRGFRPVVIQGGKQDSREAS
jgi:hypothetical protein